MNFEPNVSWHVSFVIKKFTFKTLHRNEQRIHYIRVTRKYFGIFCSKRSRVMYCHPKKLSNRIPINFKFFNFKRMLPLVALFMSFVAFSDENLHDSHPSGRLKELNVHKSNFNGPTIPVLVLACNRITVSSCLDNLVRYRPNSHQFPIIVSQVRNTNKSSSKFQQLFFHRDNLRIAITNRPEMWSNHIKKSLICVSPIRVVFSHDGMDIIRLLVTTNGPWMRHSMLDLNTSSLSKVIMKYSSWYHP